MVATAIAAAAMAIGSAAMNAYSSDKEKEAYEEYQAQVREAAIENYQYQLKSIHNQLAEEQTAASVQQQQVMIQNAQAKATAQASAAGSGVTGTTLDNMFKDYDRATASSNYIASRNLTNKGLQAEDEADAAYISALNTINGVQDYSSSTNWSSALLSGVGTALQTYSYYQGSYYGAGLMGY